METADAGLTTELTKMIQAATEEAARNIREEISKSADSIYRSLSEKITTDLTNQIRNQVTAQLRGQTLFEEPANRTDCPWKAQIKPFADEYVFMTRANGYTYTNYGRIVDGTKQIREPGAKLTAEIMGCVKAATNNDVTACTGCRSSVIHAIIDKYSITYAFAHNSVHDTKVEEVRKEIKKELVDEFAKLADGWAKIDEAKAKLMDIDSNNNVSAKLNEKQAELLKTERKEFDLEVAKEKERRKSEQELETAKKQISLIKKQLIKEVARIDKQKELLKQEKESLKQEREQLDQLRKKLSEREFLLNMSFNVENGSDAEDESSENDTSTESDD